jgi:hypothetical protein
MSENPHPTPDATAALAEETLGEMYIDLNQLFYHLLSDLDAQVSLAEAKANLILGANAILVATTALGRGVVHDVLFEADISAPERVSVVLATFMVFSLIASVFFALATSMPNIRKPRQTANVKLNPFFFGHITQQPVNAYSDTVLNMPILDIKRSLLAQVHAKSFIVQRKFRIIRLSMIWLLAALTFWVMSQISLALAW